MRCSHLNGCVGFTQTASKISNLRAYSTTQVIPKLKSTSNPQRRLQLDMTWCTSTRVSPPLRFSQRAPKIWIWVPIATPKPHTTSNPSQMHKNFVPQPNQTKIRKREPTSWFKENLPKIKLVFSPSPQKLRSWLRCSSWNSRKQMPIKHVRLTPKLTVYLMLIHDESRDESTYYFTFAILRGGGTITLLNWLG